jgi:hypothetical protein
LKFGQVAEAALVVHVVTIVCLQLVVLEEIMLPKLLQQRQAVSTQYVLVVVGHVVKHTLVVQVWDVRVM